MIHKITVAVVFTLLLAPTAPAQHELEKKTWREIETALKQGIDTAIITIGSTEQHGPQMALAADSASGDCLAREVAERVGKAFITPNIRVGISPHHMHFPGTITVRPPILKSLVYEYVHSLAWHGFRHIAIIPTHGTNFPMAGELEEELRVLYPHVNIFSYSDADAYLGSAAVISERLGIDPATAGTHAGLSETAFMLACQPELVDLENAEQGFMGDALAMGDKLNRDGTHSISPIGVLGDPRGATVEAGKEYLDSRVTLLSDYVVAQRVDLENVKYGDCPGRWAINSTRGTHSISPIGVLGDPRGATVEAGKEYLDSRVTLLSDYVVAQREGWTPEIPGDLADAVTARRNGDFDTARQLLQEKPAGTTRRSMIVLELARVDTLEDRIDSARGSLEALLAETTGNETREKIHDELALVPHTRAGLPRPRNTSWKRNVFADYVTIRRVKDSSCSTSLISRPRPAGSMKR